MIDTRAQVTVPTHPGDINTPPEKGFTALVVAHPDDEALWLSSAIASADRIILCFGDLFARPRDSAARRAAAAALPLRGLVSLDIPESGVLNLVDWARPQPTPAGIAITDAAARGRYEANYPRLVTALGNALAGAGAVYTHNPWGEYGHADHIQVHRAVAALQGDIGYTIRFTNYGSRKSWPLACRLSAQLWWSERRSQSPDRDIARRLMRVYKDHGIWTWNTTHRWPRRETLYGIPPPGSPLPRYPMAGEWLLDVAALCWWPPSLRAGRLRLKAAG